MRISRESIAVACCLVGAFAVPVLAAGDEHGGGKPPIVPDLWQAGFTIVVFIGLVLILGRFAFRPILDGLKRREEFIRDSLEQAKKDREKAEVLFKQHEEQLKAARSEASSIVDEGRRDAEVLRRKIEDTAKTEATAMVDRARREIQIATDTALKELYSVSAKLATDVASRVIQKEVDPQQHERLIDESIQELLQAYRN